MRTPNRKPGKYTFATFDPVMTQEKFNSLQTKLERILTVTRPQAIKETRQYAENGDFSENAEYQIAKGRLRGLNKTIDELQQQLSHAQIIPSPQNNLQVQTGHTVTISTNTTKQTFQILGPIEANPQAGIISYKSPLGALLLGHKVGDTVSLSIGDKVVPYKILEIR